MYVQLKAAGTYTEGELTTGRVSLRTQRPTGPSEYQNKILKNTSILERVPDFL